MKISKAVNFCLKCQQSNSKENTIKNYKFVLGKFKTEFNGSELESIKAEDVITFLTDLTDGRKQNTKRGRHMTLSAFFNLTINTVLPDMKNPCLSPVAKKLFHKPRPFLTKILLMKQFSEQWILETG